MRTHHGTAGKREVQYEQDWYTRMNYVNITRQYDTTNGDTTEEGLARYKMTTHRVMLYTVYSRIQGESAQGCNANI